jgi:two-component system, sensor histidine kinase PdtaS
MENRLDRFFDFLTSSDALTPHGFCLLWQPGLIGLHIVSDAIIGLSYYSIPLALITFIRRRTDIEFSWIFWLFGAFIMACGTTHWLDIWTIWHPDYGIQGLVKAITALVSLVTAGLLWPLIPKLLAIPSVQQLRDVNAALTAQMHDRAAAQTALTTLNSELEARVTARTAELTQLNQVLRKSEDRFRRVVESAPSPMVMVDRQGRIQMINGPAERLFGYDRAELLEQKIELLVPGGSRDQHPALRLGFFAEPVSRPMGAGRDLYAVRKDGSEFPVEIGLNPIETDEGVMVLSAIVDISDRKQKEERLEAALKEKDVLLGEIHHRVKNNLQIVHSLLDLQSARIEDKTALDMVRDSQNRIRSMGLIHQTLYQSKDFARVDFRSFLDSLRPILLQSYIADPGRITLTIDAAGVLLPIETAIPAGLLVNELLSNALKHAFPGGEAGEIAISLAQDQNEVTLTISDNGIGIADAFDLEETATLGLQLVTLLTDQLGGTMSVQRANPTRFALRFPIRRYGQGAA